MRRADAFDLRIADFAEGQVSPQWWSTIYWNEIDQYVYFYRTETFNLLSDRIAKAFEWFEDRVTAACIVRQVEEIVLSACANQWVLTTAYNGLQNDLSSRNEQFAGILWQDLESFVISLCCWSKKSIQQLADLLGRDGLVQELVDDYIDTDYRPPPSRHTAIAGFVAEHFDDLPEVEYTNLTQCVARLRSSYDYLCKFVHPNPQQLKVPPRTRYSDDDVACSVKVCALSMIDDALQLLQAMFLDRRFVSLRFCSLVQKYVSTATKKPLYDYRDESGLFASVLSRFRDVRIATTKGDVEIHKQSNEPRYSKRGRKLAQKFEALSDEAKGQVERLVSELRSEQAPRKRG